MAKTPRFPGPTFSSTPPDDAGSGRESVRRPGLSSAPAAAPSARLSGLLVLVMLGMLVVPATLTLLRVRKPAVVTAAADATPYGYTWSLLLFVVPIVVIAFWLLPSEGLELPRKAFWRTIALLVPLGCGLDFFFAHRFFLFPNPAATLGIGAPALGGPVPVEEYLFYLTGFLAVLLIYLWMGEYWLEAYSRVDHAEVARAIPRLLRFHPWSLVAGALLIVLALGIKRLVLHEAGFPAYFAFLVAAAFVPSMSFLPAVRPFINWRALSLTMFFVLLVSLIWEATLALPYGWWGFQDGPLIGIRVGAWSHLPVEEVCLWVAVTYATAIVFETVKLWQASGRSLRQAFMGPQAMKMNAK